MSNDLRPVFKYFWERALTRRGHVLGPDENVSLDMRDGMDDAIVFDAWWLKGYGRDCPRRHSTRRVYLSGWASKEKIFDIFYGLAEEMVLELFPRNRGKWRLFNRRPRCMA